jgi:hypothetical protein
MTRQGARRASQPQNHPGDQPHGHERQGTGQGLFYLTRQCGGGNGENRSGDDRQDNGGDHAAPEVLKAGSAIRLDEVGREYSDNQRCFEAFAESDEKISENGVSFDYREDVIGPLSVAAR